MRGARSFEIYDNVIQYTGTTWPDAIITDCDTASHNVSLAAADDLYDAILGDDQMFSLVEQDGYMVTGAIAHPQMRGLLRNVRATDGMPILNRDPATPMQWMLDGAPFDAVAKVVDDEGFRIRISAVEWPPGSSREPECSAEPRIYGASAAAGWPGSRCPKTSSSWKRSLKHPPAKF